MPCQEREVHDYLRNGLTGFKVQIVDLGGVMKRFPNSDFFLQFFGDEIGIKDLQSGSKEVYLFTGPDTLTTEQINVLKYAEDLFERTSRVNGLITSHGIYPLVMHSLITGQRIMFAPEGNVRTLQTVQFTGV